MGAPIREIKHNNLGKNSKIIENLNKR